MFDAIRDFGGHDILALADAMLKSQEDPNKPCIILAHTLKGWGLRMAAQSGNHSMIPPQDEMDELREAQGIGADTLFERYAPATAEGEFLNRRGQTLYEEIQTQHQLKQKNQDLFQERMNQQGMPPESMDINLKMASYPHTQWMLGQLTSKLTRIANTPLDESQLKDKQKPLKENEIPWKLPGEMMVYMAPDVGTSTNLNPSMDGKIFGIPVTDDVEMELDVKDDKQPDLVPGEDVSDRFIRFDIEEGNVMSCMGSYGRLRDLLGIPLIPLMTVYDFFVKRALDQFFYDLYWQSSFILVGTPSGVTLSPEGAQHGWKSDFQIPNQIVWEPFYCVELDWIIADAIRRHLTYDNEGRSGVHVRGVTRGVEQKDFIKLLRTQKRFKSQDVLLAPKDLQVEGAVNENQIDPIDDRQIMEQVRQDTLNGAYHLIDYRGYAGYEPGDNVVNIFAMGSLGTEAIKASKELLNRGIYANVIIVTSPDLLVGNLAHQNDYQHLKHTLGVNADLHLQPQLNGSLGGDELVTVSGRRVPCVSVHDGEPGLLDNIGSIIGVRQEALAVRKHSKCGRPEDIYRYHAIDSDAVVEACGKVLSETAMENVRVSPRALQDTNHRTAQLTDWRQLWPNITKQ